MKKNLLFLNLFFYSLISISQNLTVERLNSTKLDGKIYLNFIKTDKILRFTTKESDVQATNISWGKDFDKEVFGLKSKSLQFHFNFLNPLKYSVSFSSKESDDPMAENITKFINSLSEFGSELIPELKKITDEAKENVKKTAPAPAGFNANCNADFVKSESLYEFILFNEINLEKCTNKNNQSYCDFISTLRKLEEHAHSTTFKKGLAKSVSDLSKIDKVDVFNNSASTLLSKLDFEKDKFTLDNNDIDLKDIKETIIKLKSDKLDWIDESKCTTLKLYSKSKLSSYLESVEKLVNTQINLLKSYKTILEGAKLTKFDLSKNTVESYSLKLGKGKIAETEITINEVEIKVENDKISQSTKEVFKDVFRITPYTEIVTEFSIGYLYFIKPLEFPKYELVNNKPVESGVNTAQVIPVTSLTMLPRWGSCENACLQFQIGATLANKQPILHFGVGGRFFSQKNTPIRNISIMGGYALQGIQKPEESVTYENQKALDTGLKMEIKGGQLYVGFQFNL